MRPRFIAATGSIPITRASLFGNYSDQWLQDRVLKVRTPELCQGLLRNHLLPTFRAVRMSDIDEAAVRRWRKERLDTGRHARRPFGPVTIAKPAGFCTRYSRLPPMIRSSGAIHAEWTARQGGIGGA